MRQEIRIYCITDQISDKGKHSLRSVWQNCAVWLTVRVIHTYACTHTHTHQITLNQYVPMVNCVYRNPRDLRVEVA